MSTWTEETKQQMIEEYVNVMHTQFDTDEARSMGTPEVISQLSTKYGHSVNGVRTTLVRAGVYFKAIKTASKPATTGGAGGARINKAEAIQDLKNKIAAIDSDLIDDSILEKLTGKAAVYFSNILAIGGK